MERVRMKGMEVVSEAILITKESLAVYILNHLFKSSF